MEDGLKRIDFVLLLGAWEPGRRFQPRESLDKGQDWERATAGSQKKTKSYVRREGDSRQDPEPVIR